MARFIIAGQWNGSEWYQVASFHTIECAERKLDFLRENEEYGVRYIIVRREMLPYFPIRSAA